jgi:hypothetical protein
MLDCRHITTPQAPEADASAVESDDRGRVDRESHPAAVELANRHQRRSHPDDDAAVDGLLGRRARRREHEGGAEHQPKPSHAPMLADTRQGGVCGV